jgi:2-polyprenyl-6-methoxyphenol hydroxylase-like FAD-dependent oxidoreductase
VTGTFAGGERIRASYLIGADGTHSTVREQAGIGFDASEAGASYWLADVHLSGGVHGVSGLGRDSYAAVLTQDVTVRSARASATPPEEFPLGLG